MICSWVFLPPGAVRNMWYIGWYREWSISIVNKTSLGAVISNLPHFYTDSPLTYAMYPSCTRIKWHRDAILQVSIMTLYLHKRSLFSSRGPNNLLNIRFYTQSTIYLHCEGFLLVKVQNCTLHVSFVYWVRNNSSHQSHFVNVLWSLQQNCWNLIMPFLDKLGRKALHKQRIISALDGSFNMRSWTERKINRMVKKFEKVYLKKVSTF